MKVSLRQLIERLKQRGEWQVARTISNHCQFKLGMTYNETVALLHTVWPEMSEAFWAEMMLECDYWESQG